MLSKLRYENIQLSIFIYLYCKKSYPIRFLIVWEHQLCPSVCKTFVSSTKLDNVFPKRAYYEDQFSISLKNKYSKYLKYDLKKQNEQCSIIRYKVGIHRTNCAWCDFYAQCYIYTCLYPVDV